MTGNDTGPRIKKGCLLQQPFINNGLRNVSTIIRNRYYSVTGSDLHLFLFSEPGTANFYRRTWHRTRFGVQ